MSPPVPPVNTLTSLSQERHFELIPTLGVAPSLTEPKIPRLEGSPPWRPPSRCLHPITPLGSPLPHRGLGGPGGMLRAFEQIVAGSRSRLPQRSTALSLLVPRMEGGMHLGWASFGARSIDVSSGRETRCIRLWLLASWLLTEYNRSWRWISSLFPTY